MIWSDTGVGFISHICLLYTSWAPKQFRKQTDLTAVPGTVVPPPPSHTAAPVLWEARARRWYWGRVRGEDTPRRVPAAPSALPRGPPLRPHRALAREPPRDLPWTYTQISKRVPVVVIYNWDCTNDLKMNTEAGVLIVATVLFFFHYYKDY